MTTRDGHLVRLLRGQDLTEKLMAHHWPLFINTAFILWERLLWQHEARVKSNGTGAERQPCKGAGRRRESESQQPYYCNLEVK